MHSPSQARRIRSAPLPDDVVVLLRIASGDEEAISQAAGKLGRSRETVREAATFYVVQILLFPDADSYRVLGAKPQATNGELRRNMTLLLRWLHPDLDPKGELSVFAARVTRAWNDLKTPERRADYDRLQRKSLADKSLLRKKGRPTRTIKPAGFQPAPRQQGVCTQDMWPPVALCLSMRASASAFYAGCCCCCLVERRRDGREQRSLKFATGSSPILARS